MSFQRRQTRRKINRIYRRYAQLINVPVINNGNLLRHITNLPDLSQQITDEFFNGFSFH
jgi:hypothetical protein